MRTPASSACDWSRETRNVALIGRRRSHGLLRGHLANLQWNLVVMGMQEALAVALCLSLTTGVLCQMNKYVKMGVVSEKSSVYLPSKVLSGGRERQNICQTTNKIVNTRHLKD